MEKIWEFEGKNLGIFITFEVNQGNLICDTMIYINSLSNYLQVFMIIVMGPRIAGKQDGGKYFLHLPNFPM